MRLMHEQPERSWTVRMLAAGVGMSRSGFAARFAQVVGEAPVQYLTRWRLQKAAALLTTRNTDVAEVAAAVGYESTAAFSKAFKRSVGVTPGAYRRGRRGAAA
jgi:AraC-like DNA-binding protein